MIDYLRISVTDRCNYRCTYCMPPEGVASCDHGDILSFEEIVRFTRAAVAAGISRVRITGGEPLVRRGCSSLVASLAAIPGVADLSLTTNGALLGRFAADLKAAGLSRINISIDSLNPRRYQEITRGAALAPALAGLERALAAGFSPVKVNAVLLEGVQEDLEAFVRLSRERPVHVRFIEFMPIGHRRGGVWKFIPRMKVLQMLSAFGELRPVKAPPGGGPARYFRFPEAAGTVGFISSMSDHFCSRCNRLRLTADGRLRNCLFSDEETDMRPLINGGTLEDLQRGILDSMNSKKYDRRLVKPGGRTMSEIGG